MGGLTLNRQRLAWIALGDLNGEGYLDIVRTDVWYENYVPPPPGQRGGGRQGAGGGAQGAPGGRSGAGGPQAAAGGGTSTPSPGVPQPATPAQRRAGKPRQPGRRLVKRRPLLAPVAVGVRAHPEVPVLPGSRWLVHALGYVAAPPAGQPAWANWATRAVVADINGDGKNDVVQGDAEFAGGKVWWMENKDARTWVRHDLSPSDRRYGAWHSILVHDFTGDGRPDVFASEMDWQRARGDENPKHYIFENTGTGTPWKVHVVADLNLGGHEPVAADVTGDGCIDIVTKPWSPSPNNAVGGSPYVLFMHNISAGCK